MKSTEARIYDWTEICIMNTFCLMCLYTVHVDSFPHRKWRKIKLQTSMLSGKAVPGCCWISLHFLWGKLSTRTVHVYCIYIPVICQVLFQNEAIHITASRRHPRRWGQNGRLRAGRGRNRRWLLRMVCTMQCCVEARFYGVWKLLSKVISLQCSCSGWPTGNGKKVSNRQACCLAQLCQAAAYFLSISCGLSYVRRLYATQLKGEDYRDGRKSGP